jgi:wyosine [tRNA(Phe)-imidazoG37] synthetase (radical SAM superfamily)
MELSDRIGSLAAVKDHARSYADLVYVYPVISRRSRGLSIGINLNPDKVCNFDCIYCEVDRRTPGRASIVDPDRLEAELRIMVDWVQSGRLAADPKFAEAPDLARRIRDFAFSGDGEPTMAHNFAECVRRLLQVRRATGTEDAAVVLITDAAGLDKADVRCGLDLMDAAGGQIWAKLDAGTEAYYRLVNRSPVQFDRILKNLLQTARARPIMIQTLFLRVRGEPMPEAELEAYCGRLNTLVEQGARIAAVQAYTVARPTPEAFATKLDPAELERMAAVVRARTGLHVDVFA